MTQVLHKPDQVISELSERMQNFDYIQSNMDQESKEQSDKSLPVLSFQENASLGDGCSSLILLFSVLNQQRDVESTIHQYIIKLKQAIEQRGIHSLSLYSGLTGICFAMQQASSTIGEVKYSRMLNSLEECLLANIEDDYLSPLRLDTQHGVPSFMALHDVISGLSGIGRYALERLSDNRFNTLSEKIISHLIARVQPMTIEGLNVPGWALSYQDPYYHNRKAVSKKYIFNLGVAHGVSGILALLSIACLKGFTIKGQLDSIRFLAEWIRNKSFIINGRTEWASEISWEEETGSTPQSKEYRKDPAWCYGALGLSRTLFLAGKALGDEDLKSFALTAFRQIFLGRSSEWNLPTPSLCHGTSGFLLITHEMAVESGCKDLLSKSNSLEKELLDQYNPDLPLGFKDQEMKIGGNFIQVTNPGFINGTAGILLTLLHRKSPSQTWHLPLLIT